MHAVVGHRKLRHSTLQSEELEVTGATEDGQPVKVMVPELGIIEQFLKGAEQGFGVLCPALLLERLFQLANQVPEADRVLLTFREAAVSGLIKGQARGLTLAQQLIQGLTIERSVHARPRSSGWVGSSRDMRSVLGSGFDQRGVKDWLLITTWLQVGGSSPGR